MNPFEGDVFLEEAGRPSESENSDWWLNSGAYFYSTDPASTIHWDLPEGDPWRERYAESSPADTANGRRPQCLFRLLSRFEESDFRVNFQFRIRWLNKLDSPKRNAWSGVFLMFRYQDADNLYYAGIRHDGQLVIKRKLNGRYTTIAQDKTYEGIYDRDENPNLIPDGWHTLQVLARGTGLSCGIDNRPLAVEAPNGLRMQAVCHDSSFSVGRIGIRTDFADVEFREWKIEEISEPKRELTIEERVTDLEQRVAVLEHK